MDIVVCIQNISINVLSSFLERIGCDSKLSSLDEKDL